MADEENPGGLIRGKSPLHQALDAVVGIERRKVVTGPQDSVGLMFYNVDVGVLLCDNKLTHQSTKTQKSAAGNYKPGTYVVQALRQIVVEDIKRLFQLLETANQQYDEQSESDEPTVEPAILRETFPPIDSKDELNVADVFVTCNFLFRDG
jgi:ATP-dependent DNA helicase 2 subunit 1